MQGRGYVALKEELVNGEPYFLLRCPVLQAQHISLEATDSYVVAENTFWKKSGVGGLYLSPDSLSALLCHGRLTWVGSITWATLPSGFQDGIMGSPADVGRNANLLPVGLPGTQLPSGQLSLLDPFLGFTSLWSRVGMCDSSPLVPGLPTPLPIIPSLNSEIAHVNMLPLPAEVLLVHKLPAYTFLSSGLLTAGLSKRKSGPSRAGGPGIGKWRVADVLDSLELPAHLLLC